MSCRAARLALWTGVLLASVRSSLAQQVLYGGNEYLQVPSVNSGWLVRVDPETGAVTPVGQPAGVARLSGLAFDADGTLWAATVSGSPSGTFPTSTLIRLDPADGSLRDDWPRRRQRRRRTRAVENLAIQPGPNVLFGTRGIADQDLEHAADVYRIDKATRVATLAFDDDDGYQEASIAFAPSGALCQSLWTCCTRPGGNARFQSLDRTTGAVLTSVAIPDFYRPWRSARRSRVRGDRARLLRQRCFGDRSHRYRDRRRSPGRRHRPRSDRRAGLRTECRAVLHARRLVLRAEIPHPPDRAEHPGPRGVVRRPP